MKQERERVNERVTAEKLRIHQMGQHGIVCHMQELLQSWIQDSWEANPTFEPERERERLNPLMTRSLFTIEEDCDSPQTAHLAVTTKQA